MKFSINKILLIEASLMGLITLGIGSLLIKTFNKKPITNDQVILEKYKKNKFNQKIILFLTGFIIHIVYKISGLDKKICEKQGIAGLLTLSKIMKNDVNNIENIEKLQRTMAIKKL